MGRALGPTGTPGALSSGRGLHRFANPGRFLRLSGRVQPWLTGAALLVLAVALP
ncbi:heme ABC transporter permease, partial [Roseicella frigidaeris]